MAEVNRLQKTECRLFSIADLARFLFQPYSSVRNLEREGVIQADFICGNSPLFRASRLQEIAKIIGNRIGARSQFQIRKNP
jgi:hypothetical protein